MGWFNHQPDKHGGLEDDVPFQLGHLLGSKGSIFHLKKPKVPNHFLNGHKVLELCSGLLVSVVTSTTSTLIAVSWRQRCPCWDEVLGDPTKDIMDPWDRLIDLLLYGCFRK